MERGRRSVCIDKCTKTGECSEYNTFSCGQLPLCSCKQQWTENCDGRGNMWTDELWAGRERMAWNTESFFTLGCFFFDFFHSCFFFHFLIFSIFYHDFSSFSNFFFVDFFFQNFPFHFSFIFFSNFFTKSFFWFFDFYHLFSPFSQFFSIFSIFCLFTSPLIPDMATECPAKCTSRPNKSRLFTHKGKKKLSPHFIAFFPVFFSKFRTRRSMFSHPSSSRQCDSGLPQAAATQLPSLMHFPTQTGPDSDGSSMLPAQAPNPQERERETISPDQFCQMTSRARLSTLCSYCSTEHVPSLSVQESTSLSQSGLLGQPTSACLLNLETCYHLTQRYFLLTSCAYRTQHTLSMSPLGGSAQCPPSLRGRSVLSFYGSRRAHHAAHTSSGIPDAGCRAQSHNIPVIQKRPRPFASKGPSNTATTTTTTTTPLHPTPPPPPSPPPNTTTTTRRFTQAQPHTRVSCPVKL